MYQFLHINSYSRIAPKKSKIGGHSLASIVGEALRDSHFSTHITNPQPPKHLYGQQLELLAETCDEWCDSILDASGKRTRKDALCFIAGVISVSSETDSESWELIKQDSISWLIDKYGGRLRTVIEHIDEAHPHIHFYVVPLPGERFELIHDGKLAAAGDKDKPKGAQNRSYKHAMRQMLDDYNMKVGMQHGLLRLGPRRRRLTRSEWKAEQIHSKEIKDRALEAERASAGLRVRACELKRMAQVKGYTQGKRQACADFASLSTAGKILEYLFSSVTENVRLNKRLKIASERLDTLKEKLIASTKVVRSYKRRLLAYSNEVARMQREVEGYEYLKGKMKEISVEKQHLLSTVSNLESRNRFLERSNEIPVSPEVAKKSIRRTYKYDTEEMNI